MTGLAGNVLDQELALGKKQVEDNSYNDSANQQYSTPLPSETLGIFYKLGCFYLIKELWFRKLLIVEFQVYKISMPVPTVVPTSITGVPILSSLNPQITSSTPCLPLCQIHLNRNYLISVYLFTFIFPQMCKFFLFFTAPYMVLRIQKVHICYSADS